jgi:hypothetical protein
MRVFTLRDVQIIAAYDQLEGSSGVTTTVDALTEKGRIPVRNAASLEQPTCPTCSAADREDRREMGMGTGEACWDNWHAAT